MKHQYFYPEFKKANVNLCAILYAIINKKSKNILFITGRILFSCVDDLSFNGDQTGAKNRMIIDH